MVELKKSKQTFTVKRVTLKTQDALWSYFFVSPFLLGLIIFTIGPMIASLYYSFTEYNILTPPNWIGLENYTKLLADALFWQSIKVTLYFAVWALPLNLIIGYLLAILLNQKVPGLNLWRTLYYLPSVISGVAVAVLWSRLFNPNLGWINFFLKSIGLYDPPGWLQDPHWAVPALIIMSLWSVGGTMIIYLSGLQGVPTTLYEAARVDGANKFQSFVNITLPMTSPVIFFNLVMGLIGTFQYFTVAYTTSGGTGGPARSTLFYNLYLYQNAFTYFQMGYASAMAWILFFIVLVLTLVVFRSSAAWVFYEGEVRA
jgi:multiple sugar transport system permease protein